jgi:hypothetical protein
MVSYIEAIAVFAIQAMIYLMIFVISAGCFIWSANQIISCFN